MSNIELYKSEIECCGCGACDNICPKKAINMEYNDKGFLYPKVKLDLCVECGACLKVCAYKKEKSEIEVKDRPCYALTNNNDEVLKRSSSGGAFSAIVEALYSKEKNSIIYGAKFNKNMDVIHCAALKKEDYYDFCTSKYVQSNLKESFKEIETYLKDGRTVLFSGTPCQIDAIKSYLIFKKINIDNLYTVDIICHGTPSPGLWKNYVEILENKFGKIKKYSFRYKESGWIGYPGMILFENGKKRINDKYTQMFTNVFFTNKILRESCYSCKYANMNRVSDITIGDYWGAKEVLSEQIKQGLVNLDKGISEIIVNTDKGKTLIDSVKQSNSCVLSTNKNYISYQHNLMKPTAKSENSETFWIEYKSKGAKYVLKKYGKFKLKNRIKRLIKFKTSKLFMKSLYLGD